MEKAMDTVQDGADRMKASVADTFEQFASPEAVGATSSSTQVGSFLTSNTLIAKFAFLVLVLIVFIILVNLGIKLVGYFMRPSATPYVVYGMIDGTDGQVVSQDPKRADAVPVSRSNDQTTGMEFTWSVWLNVASNKGGQYQNIFNKGSSMYNRSSMPGVASVNNAPGLYLAPLDNNENTLRIVMDTVDPNVESVTTDVTEIPFNKWVNVVVRLENTLLDVYVNGTITNRVALTAVPKQNYDDINVCQNGGFNGKLSNLRYYNYALSAFEINALVMGGPNTSVSKLSSANKSNGGSQYYLSSSWYTDKY